MLTPTIPLLVAALVAQPLPRIDRIEPARVEPYQSVSLRLQGSGFSSGGRVYIEGAHANQFVAHAPAFISGQICKLTLPLGFGASPSLRRIYIENPDGRQSNAVELHIERGAHATPDEREPREKEPPASSTPVLEALRPAAVPPGRPFVLEVLGRGFDEGAHVEITVNVNAGSSRLPEYGAQRFDAHRLDDGLLEVELERGFFPIPGLRDIVVVNPDGGPSRAMSLRIQPMEDER